MNFLSFGRKRKIEHYPRADHRTPDYNHEKPGRFYLPSIYKIKKKSYLGVQITYLS
jgi:hypothetical protein